MIQQQIRVVNPSAIRRGMLVMPVRRGVLVTPDELEWMIKRNAADATSVSPRKAKSEGHARRARRSAMDDPIGAHRT